MCTHLHAQVDPEADSALEKLLMMDNNQLGSSIQKLRHNLAAQSARVLDLFKRWDTSGDGKVSKDEFRHAMITDLGFSYSSTSDLNSLFTAFDTDGSGHISFRELSKMLRKMDDDRDALEKIRRNSRKGSELPVETAELKQQIMTDLNLMAARHEMALRTSAELKQELDDIDEESTRFRMEQQERRQKRRVAIKERHGGKHHLAISSQRLSRITKF